MLISVENLTKKVISKNGELTILKGLNFSVEEGEFLSVMGPSGAGKSTLISVLGCLMSFSSGNVKIAGQSIGELSSSELAVLRNRWIGFIFQDYLLLDGFSVLENILLPLHYRFDISAEEGHRRAMELLERVGLGHKAKSFPKQLSGGQKQKVAIARALVIQPKVIFADEPCGALDPISRLEVLALLQELGMQGVTTVMVTHNQDDADHSRRVLMIEDGFLASDLAVERVLIASPRIKKAEEDDSKSLDLIDLNFATPSPWNQIRLLSEKPSPVLWASVLKVFQSVKESFEIEKSLRMITKYCKESYALNDLMILLQKFLPEKNWRVRFAVGELLLEIVKKNPNQWKELPGLAEMTELCVSDPMSDMRHFGFRILLHAKGLFSEEQLFKHIQENKLNPDSRVRGDVALICGFVPYDQVKDLLRVFLKDLNSRVRSNALVTLWSLVQSHGISPLSLAEETLFFLEDPSNRLVADAVVFSHPYYPEACNPALKKLLMHEAPEFVASGIFAASRVNPSMLQLSLPRLLAHPSERVQAAIGRFAPAPIDLGKWDQATIDLFLSLKKV
jgi:putative ABC transport system ATP-binding protein